MQTDLGDLQPQKYLLTLQARPQCETSGTRVSRTNQTPIEVWSTGRLPGALADCPSTDRFSKLEAGRQTEAKHSQRDRAWNTRIFLEISKNIKKGKKDMYYIKISIQVLIRFILISMLYRFPEVFHRNLVLFLSLAVLLLSLS